MVRKRLYEIKYGLSKSPVYVEDAGHLLKISGIFLQGMDTGILLFSPTADVPPMFEEGKITETHVYMSMGMPTLEEWCEILRRTDDPLVFEKDETGTIKAIHRKQQFAISGAIQQQVWARDEFRCMYCGRMMGDVQLTVDHWVPLENGGENDVSNYLSACRQCNKRKGDMPPWDFCNLADLDHVGLSEYLAGNAPATFITHLQNLDNMV